MKRRLLALPLAVWEREGLKSALVKAGLPADDVGDPHQLSWRFESHEDVPVGFGGLEVHGDEALLHSVVTLPPLRELGMGAAIVATLEDEARAHRCRAIYLLTESERDFFARLGYAACAPGDVPDAVRSSGRFKRLWDSAAMMVKHVG
jgi:N-acetylglutamate synthase-like GNAT family acetyltransferase